MIAARALLAQWRLILVAVLLGLLAWQTVRLADAQKETAVVRADLAGYRETQAESARLGERANRAEETRRAGENRKIDDETKLKIAAAEVAAAGARTAADGLRQRVASLVAAAGRAASNPAAPAVCPATDAAPVLAELLGRVTGFAERAAGAADRARIAGLACEAQHFSLQPGESVPQVETAP